MADEENIAGLRTRLALIEQRLAESLRAEAALRETEAWHRLLIESWAQAEWETDMAAGAGPMSVPRPCVMSMGRSGNGRG
jgi:PAS domain-containing protein